MPEADSISLIVGATGGLGHALTKHLLTTTQSTIVATCRAPTGTLSSLATAYPTRLHILPQTDLLSASPGAPIAAFLRAQPHPLRRVYLVAGLLVADTLSAPRAAAAVDMFRVCALGPLLVVSALRNARLLAPGCKLGIVTSEGGSVALRTPREGAGSYGHHMSKAAANMLGRLLSIDLAPAQVPVVCIHPGFIRTAMTRHYSDSYDELGAVEPHVAADGVFRAVEQANMQNTGQFVAPLGGESLGFGVYALQEELKPMGQLPW